jgi:predicted transcriptional regulator
MEVHFTPELQARLDRAAADLRSAPDQYVQQFVERYIDHDVWFRQKVTASVEQLDRGEFLTHAEVGARLKKLAQP